MPTKLQVLRRHAIERQAWRCWNCIVRKWLTTPDELPGARQPVAGAGLLKCTAEHLLARVDGGLDTSENVVAACGRCNWTRHKRKRPPPPPPQAYRAEVARRTMRGTWHDRWVFEKNVVAVGRLGVKH